MKSILLILLITVYAQVAICQTSSASSRATDTDERLAKVAEAARLAQSVIALYNAGKYDEAFPIAKRVVLMREQLFQKDDDTVIAVALYHSSYIGHGEFAPR